MINAKDGKFKDITEEVTEEPAEEKKRVEADVAEENLNEKTGGAVKKKISTNKSDSKSEEEKTKVTQKASSTERLLMEARALKVAKSKKPKTFTPDGSEVFTQDVKTKLDAELEKLEPNLQKLIFAKQSTTYLTARVSGVRNTPEGPCAFCFFGESPNLYTILIPFEDFTEDTDEELEKARINRKIFLERRIGTEIDFVPMEMGEDNKTFYGNRRLAMMIKAYEYWFATDKGAGKDSLKFTVGSKIGARVVGVYPKAGVRVEIYGVESHIPIHEVSYTRLSNLRDAGVILGEEIEVCITDLRRDKQQRKVSFSASIKRCGADPRLEAYERLNVGDIVLGEVSNIQYKEDSFDANVFVRLDGGGEALCARLSSQELREGTHVRVEIGQKYITADGEPRLACKIRHVF